MDPWRRAPLPVLVNESCRIRKSTGGGFNLQVPNKPNFRRVDLCSSVPGICIRATYAFLHPAEGDDSF